jgi:hypothetical protein
MKHGGHRQSEVVAEDRCQQRRQSSEQANARGQAVHAVDEVEGVGAGEQPKQAERHREPDGGGLAMNVGEPGAERDGKNSGNCLAAQLLPGL